LSESEPKLRRWVIPAGVFIAITVIGIAFLLTIGRFLVVQDSPAHADVIVVLSGRMPERALEAARLYQAGYADKVWISAPPSPEEELKAMNIFYVGEDFYNEKVLLSQHVPVDAIQIMERPNENTEEEVRQISELVRNDKLHTVIVVTSKAHTRRVRTIWHKLVGSDSRVDPRIIVRYATDDPFDGAHWWRHTQDGLDVVRESLGLLNAWAGFPLRPSKN
jgi:uncharacterized SAM-binding protein YcdF (DUF218 family)